MDNLVQFVGPAVFTLGVLAILLGPPLYFLWEDYKTKKAALTCAYPQCNAPSVKFFTKIVMDYGPSGEFVRQGVCSQHVAWANEQPGWLAPNWDPVRLEKV